MGIIRALLAVPPEHSQDHDDAHDFPDERHPLGRRDIPLQGSGTRRGQLRGLEPTGESFDVTALTLSRIEEGLIGRWWVEWDFAGLLNQFGTIDSPVSKD